jgi:hypothetical protein
MENLREKNQTEILQIKSPFNQTKKEVEGYSSRPHLEEVISELEDKIETKEKTEELLIKQSNSCERNMQELSDSTKRSILRIMGIEKEKRCKPKGYILYSRK